MHKFIVLTSFITLLFCNFTQQQTNKYMYVPKYSLRKSDICSVMSIALAPITDTYWKRRVDYHHSRRTMLYFLLSIKATSHNKHLLQSIDECHPNFNWTIAENNYNLLKKTIEPYQSKYKAQTLGSYWEIKIPTTASGPISSRKYIIQYRSKGFQPNELKIYWNYHEIQDLTISDHHNPITDSDTRNALLKSPVQHRKHSGTIRFIVSGIQDAVFQVPHGKQVIVLDFADERMPGGYFLENAKTQEEVILYNSDGYRALLDLKYRMMDSGYMLTEYGVAYIKNVRFFRKNSHDERLTDLIVGACYDLSEAKEGLYIPPSYHNIEDIRSRTRRKFQAIIASAVANTEGDGGNTYLLLGPIGTGAFANDQKMIAELFFEILSGPLMNSNGAIRYVFDQIWFVSINTLETFQEIFEKN